MILVFLVVWLPSCGGEDAYAPRVLLIGIEGVSWDLVDAMVKAGEAPNFARLKQQGAWGVLESDDPVNPASVWTTIATGRTETDHEVQRPIRYNSETGHLEIPSRASAALWEIAARNGVPAGVVGWPFSAPVPAGVTVRIDDLALYRGLGLAVPFPGPGFQVPPFDKEQNQYVGRIPKDGQLSARLEAASLDVMLNEAKKAWPKVRLLAVYLEGLNSSRHYAGAARALGSKRKTPPFGKPSRKHMRELDATLGKLIDLADDQTLVMVASDDPTFLPGQTMNGDFVHPTHGLVGILGPMVVTGRRMDVPTVLDFVPMALTHLGIPLSEQMPGNPFKEAWSAPPPALPRVATHDVFIRRPYPGGGELRDLAVVERAGQVKKQAQPGEQPFNDRNVYALELLNAGNLRGAWAEAMIDLGADPTNPVSQYVVGEVLVEQRKNIVALESFTQAAEALTDTPATEREKELRLIVGLAMADVRLKIRQPARAASALRPVLQLCNDCTPAIALLAQCHLAMDNAEQAISIIEQALDKRPNDARLLLTLGHARLRQEDLAGARKAWIAAIGKGDGPLEAHLELGLLSIRERQWKKAVQYLQTVTERDPQNAYAWFELASAYANLGKRGDAEKALLASLRADPADARAWLAWRKIKLAEGATEQATQMLVAARESVAISLLHY